MLLTNAPRIRTDAVVTSRHRTKSPPTPKSRNDRQVASESVKTSSVEARFNPAVNVEKLPEPGCEQRNE